MAQDASRQWRHRSDLEVLQDQLDGLAAWHRDRADQVVRERDVAGSAREARQEARRRLEVRKREQEALLAQADGRLRESAKLLLAQAPVRAVLVHRDEWFRRQVQRMLQDLEVLTAAALDNGAEGIGVVVVEQPDLLLVEDLLPMVSGLELIRRASVLSPHTVLVAHVAHADEVARFLDAGATCAFDRRTPMRQVEQELAALLPRSSRA